MSSKSELDTIRERARSKFISSLPWEVNKLINYQIFFDKTYS